MISRSKRARSIGTLAIPQHLLSATLSSDIASSAETITTQIDKELQPQYECSRPDLEVAEVTSFRAKQGSKHSERQ